MSNVNWDAVSRAVDPRDPDAVYDLIGDKITSLPFVTVDPASVKPRDAVRLVCTSDTHENYPDLPPGDVLIHAGDFSHRGELDVIRTFTDWFASQPHSHKIFIVGNHETTLDFTVSHHRGTSPAEIRRSLEQDSRFHYLQDTAIEAAGLKFYGAPWTPRHSLGFSIPRGHKIARKWAKIPSDTDVLITHGPPLGQGDLCASKHRAGCLDLLREIETRVVPKLHVFGHVHEGYGATTNRRTIFANVAACNRRYQLVNAPLVFDLFPLDIKLDALYISGK